MECSHESYLTSLRVTVKITLLGSKALSCRQEYVCLSWGTLSCHLLFPVLLSVRVCAKKWYLPSAASRQFSLATSSQSGPSCRSSVTSFLEVFLCWSVQTALLKLKFSIGSWGLKLISILVSWVKKIHRLEPTRLGFLPLRWDYYVAAHIFHLRVSILYLYWFGLTAPSWGI